MPKGKEISSDRIPNSGYGKRRHYIEFDEPVYDVQDFKAWLIENDWLGYHPNGYGSWTLEKITPFSWTGEHSASCD